MGNKYVQACYLQAQELGYDIDYCRKIVFHPGYPQFILFFVGIFISFILIVLGIYFICKHRRYANKIPLTNASQGQIQFQQPTQLQQNAQQLPYQYQQASNQYQLLPNQTIQDPVSQVQYQNRNYSPADNNFNQGALQQPTYLNAQPIASINQNSQQNGQANSEVNRYVPIQSQNETVESRRYDPTSLPQREVHPVIVQNMSTEILTGPETKPALTLNLPNKQVSQNSYQVHETSSNIRFTGNELPQRNEISQPLTQREIPLTQREVPLAQRQERKYKFPSPLIQLPLPFTAEHKQMQQQYKQRQAQYYQKLPIDFYPPPPPGFKYVMAKVNE